MHISLDGKADDGFGREGDYILADVNTPTAATTRSPAVAASIRSMASVETIR